ncbi:MAG: hypothetical protein KF691_11050 [Phycisphaeraceae bacterium]|nr:hypothetical protein [Phycisphaeraceae bacterium]
MTPVSANSDPRTAAPRCETCGYELASVLESSGPSAACPECGIPCWQSSPALRPGTPWQQRLRLTSFWLTCWLIASRTAALFRAMEASGRRAWSLLTLQSIIAAIAFLSPWSGVFVADPVRQMQFARSLSRVIQIVGVVIAQILVLAAVLGAASVLLSLLLRAYARARGWHVSRATALSIAAHAALGWTIVAGVVWTLLTAWFITTLIISSTGNPSAARALGDASGWVAAAGGRYGLLPLPILVLGAGGILVSRISLTALHSCRFANSPATLRFFEVVPSEPPK